MRYRNHEGYQDPTAGIALARASRQGQHRHGKPPKSGRLTFRLGDLASFREWVKFYSVRGCGQ